MLADLIVAGRGARFCQPEIRIGIMPGIGGTQRLVRAVGKVKAMRMALTGQPISAEEAWVAGLVSDLVEDDQVQAHALELARVIAAMPALAAEQIKGGDSGGDGCAVGDGVGVGAQGQCVVVCFTGSEGRDAGVYREAGGAV
ncbi:2,3-dehydroadipyl-CoA hydratase [Pseudomonas sp. Teo4]|nr:2,3-dehydroadipyl-CoA hydratase [Pseudomonas sp. Teo4]